MGNSNVVVTMDVTVTGLDYDKLMADTAAKDKLEQDLKASVLSSLPSSYTLDDIKIAFSRGSVNANVEITPKAGSDTVALKAVVTAQKSKINNAALESVKALPDVSKLLETGMRVADLTVTSSE